MNALVQQVRNTSCLTGPHETPALDAAQQDLHLPLKPVKQVSRVRLKRRRIP